MSWIDASLAEGADGADFDRVLGLRPELHEDFTRFHDLLWKSVDPLLLELCRVRIAELLGCVSEMRRRTPAAVAAGLDERKLAALPGWPNHAGFRVPERACLAFAEQFLLDPHGVTDEQAADVIAHLGAPGLIAFVEALAIFEGFTRFRMILDVDVPPLEYEEDEEADEAPEER
jgi:alkylhydroperoxidase family enzyme